MIATVVSFLTGAASLARRVPLKVWLIVGAIIVLLISHNIAYHRGYDAGWAKRDGLAKAAGERQAIADTAAKEIAADASAKVGQRVEAKAVEIRWRTRTITQEVPRYVTVQADSHCVVPVGFVRLHDRAAADGTTDVADPTGESFDDPSGVDLSAVAGTVTANYGTCHELRNQVAGWQAWYADTAKALAKAPEPPR